MTLFDRVFHKLDNSNEFNGAIKVAAVCLFLCSKNFDSRYLYASMFIEGMKMTTIGKDKPHQIAIDIQSLLEYECKIMTLNEFSLSYSFFFTPLDFYVRYFEVIRNYTDE